MRSKSSFYRLFLKISWLTFLLAWNRGFAWFIKASCSLLNTRKPRTFEWSRCSMQSTLSYFTIVVSSQQHVWSKKTTSHSQSVAAPCVPASFSTPRARGSSPRVDFFRRCELRIWECLESTSTYLWSHEATIDEWTHPAVCSVWVHCSSQFSFFYLFFSFFSFCSTFVVAQE